MIKMKKKYLLTPGPVELPQEVLSAAAKPLISHRCEEFSQLLSGIEVKLNKLLRSEGPVVILPSSGTGALEALAVNFLDEKSTFISVSCGTFGDRFREIALRTKARGIFIDVVPGEGVTPRLVADAVLRNERCDVLLLTHNETSTSVVNPIKEIAAAIPEEQRPLIFIDGVSSVGAIECFPLEWNVDGVASASQKGLITQPGLGFVWLSPRAWQYLEARRCPSQYFDLKMHRKELEGKLPGNPFTPPVSLYFALDCALDIILANGADKWFTERRRYARAFSAGLEAMGFELFVKDAEFRSPGVTAIKSPNRNTEEIRGKLRDMGVMTAAGMGGMKNELIRVAHYHDCGWMEMAAILGAFFAVSGFVSSNAEDFLSKAWKMWNEYNA